MYKFLRNQGQQNVLFITITIKLLPTEVFSRRYDISVKDILSDFYG